LKYALGECSDFYTGKDLKKDREGPEEGLGRTSGRTGKDLRKDREGPQEGPGRTGNDLRKDHEGPQEGPGRTERV